MGVVIRNEDGDILLAISKEIAGCFKPEIVETLTIIWALDIAISQGFKSLEVETDCFRIVKIFHGHRDFSALQSLASDIRWLAEKLHYFSFNFVKRTTNQMAHNIAKHGYNFHGPSDSFPHSGPLLLLARTDYLIFMNSSS